MEAGSLPVVLGAVQSQQREAEAEPSTGPLLDRVPAPSQFFWGCSQSGGRTFEPSGLFLALSQFPLLWGDDQMPVSSPSQNSFCQLLREMFLKLQVVRYEQVVSLNVVG